MDGMDKVLLQHTILYHKSDLSHANAWVLNNVSNKRRCKYILSCFSQSWKYVSTHLAGICRRKILLELFGEEESCAIYQVETAVMYVKPQ